jgi:hypothetical protein
MLSIMAESRIKTIRPEQLSAVEKGIASSWIRAASPGGILVGAVVGTDPWDIRPLVLDSGTMFIIRPLSPSLGQVGVAQLRTLYKVIEDLGVPGSDRSTIIVNDRGAALKRVYYQSLLAEEIASLKGSTEGRKIINFLVGFLQLLHQAGVVHGHLTPHNLGLKGDLKTVLDIGIWTTGLSAPRDAYSFNADTASGSLPTPGFSSDIFAIGKICAAILSGTASPEERDLLKRLETANAKGQPTLDEISRVFRVSGIIRQAPSMSGRVITPRVAHDSGVIPNQLTTQNQISDHGQAPSTTTAQRPIPMGEDSVNLKNKKPSSSLPYLLFLLAGALFILGYRNFYDDRSALDNETVE